MRRPGRAGPASSSLPSRAEGSSSRAGPREKSACWSRAPCCALYGRAEAVAAHMQFLAPSGPRKRLRAGSRRHVSRSGRFASGFRRLLNPVAHDHSAGISACVTGLVRSRYVSEGMVARPRRLRRTDSLGRAGRAGGCVLPGRVRAFYQRFRCDMGGLSRRSTPGRRQVRARQLRPSPNRPAPAMVGFGLPRSAHFGSNSPALVPPDPRVRPAPGRRARPGPRRAPKRMIAYKTPWCGCCGGWIAHMRQAGWIVEVVEREDLARSGPGMAFRTASPRATQRWSAPTPSRAMFRRAMSSGCSANAPPPAH